MMTKAQCDGCGFVREVNIAGDGKTKVCRPCAHSELARRLRASSVHTLDRDLQRVCARWLDDAARETAHIEITGTEEPIGKQLRHTARMLREPRGLQTVLEAAAQGLETVARLYEVLEEQQTSKA